MTIACWRTLTAVLLVSGATALAQDESPRVLDHDAYDVWNRIERSAISGDGAWVLYTLPRYLEAKDPELMTILERDFELVRVFPGTLGDGAVIVRRAAPRPRGADG